MAQMGLFEIGAYFQLFHGQTDDTPKKNGDPALSLDKSCLSASHVEISSNCWHTAGGCICVLD